MKAYSLGTFDCEIRLVKGDSVLGCMSYVYTHGTRFRSVLVSEPESGENMFLIDIKDISSTLFLEGNIEGVISVVERRNARAAEILRNYLKDCNVIYRVFVSVIGIDGTTILMEWKRENGEDRYRMLIYFSPENMHVLFTFEQKDYIEALKFILRAAAEEKEEEVYDLVGSIIEDGIVGNILRLMSGEEGTLYWPIEINYFRDESMRIENGLHIVVKGYFSEDEKCKRNDRDSIYDVHHKPQ